MPTYCISVVNAEFRVSNEVEAPSLEEAHKLGLKGSLDIGAEEIANGKPFFAAEVTLARDGEIVSRFLVSIGASSLQ